MGTNVTLEDNNGFISIDEYIKENGKEIVHNNALAALKSLYEKHPDKKDDLNKIADLLKSDSEIQT